MSNKRQMPQTDTPTPLKKGREDDPSTKSDAGQTSSEFDVPDPSISGIMDSTVIPDSSSKTTDVEEKIVEEYMSSLSDITDIEVSNSPRKHVFEKERIERQGNTYDKLYNACLKGQHSIVKDILENQKTTSISHEDGRTPLYAACLGNHQEIIKLLIDYGYDVNLQDIEGKTPLHITFENNDPDLAETLITHFHADTEIRDINYWTPLHTAIDRGFYTYSEQLSKKFLQQDVGSEVRWIQLHAACAQENTQNVQLLLDAQTDVNRASSAGHTPLHIAVKKSNINIVTLLLGQNADANSINSCHQTPLHIAVDKGQEPIIQKLLSREADPALKDEVGNTSLHLAVKSKDAKPGFFKAGSSILISDWNPFPTFYPLCNKQLVQAIIGHGAGVNAMNRKGQTALWFACSSGLTEFVKILLDAGANPNTADKNGESCLHAAVHGFCSAETIQNIIDHAAHVDAVNEDGATALLLACGSAQSEMVDVLLKAKADPNVLDSGGDASLHAAAAANCSKETLQKILEYGANVNAVNKRGRTALLLNCSYGQMDSVHVLLEAKADPNIVDEEGYSCIFAAVDGHCSKDTLQALIDHGAHIDAERKDGTNALLCACRTGQSESVKYLFEAGANANVTKPDGSTCLHVAVKGRCNKKALQKCIEKGAGINAMNNKAETALLLACESAQTESITLLLKMGGNPNIFNAYGYTALHSAVHGCCTNESLQEIISHQAYLNAQNRDGKTALWIACSYRQQEMVMILLKAGSNANIADHYGKTSLHAAVLGNCRKNIIRTMFDHGAYVNATDNKHTTSLMLASKMGNVDAINVLLSAGADRTIKGVNGDTWIHYAVRGDCSKEVLQSIIDQGAHVNITNKHNVTSLMVASNKGNVDAIKVLLSAGADRTIKDVDGNTWIHYAFLGDCSKEVLQSIIDQGANVNITNKRNVTSLMVASKKGNVDAINVLLSAGADRTIKTVNGDTWIHYAVDGDCSKEVLQSIIDQGAHVNITNKRNVTSLMVASNKGNVDAIKVLLSAGADRTIKDVDGNTWIHYAFLGDCSKEVLQSIIDQGANVNITNKRNVTSLMVASKKGNVDAINVLLSAGADRTIKTVNGDTWIHYAVDGDCSKEVLQSILDQGAHVNITNKRNVTSLMVASKMGNVDAIKVLLSAGADRTIKDVDGNTWIHYAFLGDCSKEVLQSIIDQGANVNITNKRNVTSLMVASKKGNVDAINVLLSAGADRTIKTVNGDTWIHYAVHGDCSKEVLQSIIDQGAHVNITNKRNVTSLMVASNKGNVDAIKVLLSAGADRTIKDVDGNTWIHYAFLGDCSKEVLQSIIDQGADVNITNKRNVTSLMVASKKGNVDAINVLLSAGADRTIKTVNGDTWIHYAVHGDCSKEVLQSIIDQGADVNITNKRNVTSLMVASKKGNVDATNVLLSAGADRTIKDVDGDTWIHLCCSWRL